MNFTVFKAKNKRFLLPLIIFFAAIIVALALYYLAPQTLVKAEKNQPVLIQTANLKLQDYAPNILLYGQAVSALQVGLTSRTNTNVKLIKKEEGSKVKSGEPLIILDDKYAQHVLSKAKHQVQENASLLAQGKLNLKHDTSALQSEKKLLDIQNSKLKRTEKLFKSGKGIISKQEFDNERSAYIKAQILFKVKQKAVMVLEHQLVLLTARFWQSQITVEQAQDQVDDCVIKAPFDGVITKLHVAQHEQVVAGQKLIDELPAGHMQVRALIPNSKLSIIKQSLMDGVVITAEALLTDHSNAELRLNYLSSKINSGQLGREAIFKTLDQTTPVPNGEHMTLLLGLPKIHDCFRVPLSALYAEYDLSGKKTSYIYKVTKNRLQQVVVNILGRIYNQQQMTAVLIKPKNKQELLSTDVVLSDKLPNAISGLLVKIATSPLSEKANA